MAVLDILQYPHPHLALPGERVESIDDEVKRIINDLYETMYHYEHCVGLAATQVDIQKKIAVIDVSNSRTEPICMINPEIKSREGELTDAESCMSVPTGLSENVTRAKKVTVVYWDEQGQEQNLTAENFLARAVQHEVDHLNGQLFLDRLSRLKRERIEKRLTKWRRQQQAN